MTNLSLPRYGYTNRRSPSAMLGAVAINLSVVALVIAVPATFIVPPRTPPLKTTWIPLRDPPKPVEQSKPEPKQQTRQQTLDPTTPRPTTVDTPFDQLRTGPEIALNTLPTFPGTGHVEPPYVPTVEPVLTKARPDPRYAGAFHPAYPPSLVREGLEGDVTVRVTIDARGQVIAVEMIRASNPIFFEETKRQALKSWRFMAATRDGVAVESVQTMTVHFRLEE